MAKHQAIKKINLKQQQASEKNPTQNQTLSKEAMQQPLSCPPKTAVISTAFSDKTKKSSEGAFLKGALILTAGGLVAKILGAIYRIPLTNLMGAYAMGLYQLVFPLYTLLITISMGFSVAVSKTVARHSALNKCADCKKILMASVFIMSALGALLSVLLFVFAKPIAILQGNEEAFWAYRAISPAVLLVSVSSAIKGYFQGQMEMKPTAVSQIAEQVTKLVLGLLLANAFMPNIVKAVNAAVFAVTISEVIALSIFLFYYFYYQKKTKSPLATTSQLKVKDICAKLFKIALPVTLGGVLFPLSQLVESSLVLNLIEQNATKLYGIWSGPVHSLFAMPVVLAGGVAAAILPGISSSAAKKNIEGINKKINIAFKLNNTIVLPCVTGFLLLSRPIVNILYGGLPASDLILAAKLLSASAVGSFLLSCAGMFTAVLQGVGKEYFSLLFLALGIVAKTLLNIILLPNPDINVFAVAFSTILCYFVNAGLSYAYLKKKVYVKINTFAVFTKPLACCLLMATLLISATTFAPQFANSSTGGLLLIVLAGLVYVLAVFFLKIFDGFTLANIKNLLHRGKRNGKTVLSPP